MNDRRGYTFIESLTVFGVVLILLGLILPAVQRAREAAFSISCKGNLSVIAHDPTSNGGAFFPARWASTARVIRA